MEKKDKKDLHDYILTTVANNLSLNTTSGNV
jgi:hypothetical protein